MLGQSLSASVLSKDRDISLRARLLCILQTHQSSQQLPRRHRGRCSAWEAELITASLIHTRKLKLCYRKSWGKRWFWSNLSQWLTLLSRGVCFCSTLAARSFPGAASAFPTWQGAALQGKESHGLSSTMSAGKHKAQGEIWGQREVRLQDFKDIPVFQDTPLL